MDEGPSSSQESNTSTCSVQSRSSNQPPTVLGPDSFKCPACGGSVKRQICKGKNKVENDGRSYAMCYNKNCPHRLQALAGGKRDKPGWFWWFDTTHPGVPFHPSPCHPHPVIQPQPVIPQPHQPAQFFPYNPYAPFPFPYYHHSYPFPAPVPQAAPHRRPVNPLPQQTVTVPNQPTLQHTVSENGDACRYPTGCMKSRVNKKCSRHMCKAHCQKSGGCFGVNDHHGPNQTPMNQAVPATSVTRHTVSTQPMPSASADSHARLPLSPQIKGPSHAPTTPSVVSNPKKRSYAKPLDRAWAEVMDREEKLFEEKNAKEVQRRVDVASRKIMINLYVADDLDAESFPTALDKSQQQAGFRLTEVTSLIHFLNENLPGDSFPKLLRIRNVRNCQQRMIPFLPSFHPISSLSSPMTNPTAHDCSRNPIAILPDWLVRLYLYFTPAFKIPSLRYRQLNDGRALTSITYLHLLSAHLL
ncbi:hypothetical protein FRC03_001435 [Tulasnella sp. 419]|nr:hypothetical protein FRC03_001435 [Tulasnella sp. 419]